MPDPNPSDPGRGRTANSPRQIPALGWKDIAARVWRSFDEDRVMLVAAGVTFYLLLAMFPALAAFVSLYGLFADPSAIADQMATLRGVIPDEGLALLTEQLRSLAAGRDSSLTLGLVISFLIAFWSANTGMKAIIEAMNIAHEEREKRSFVMLTLLSFALTLGAMALAVAMIVAVAVVPAVLAFLDPGGLGAFLLRFVRWPLLLVVVSVAVAALYRWAPSRKTPEWRWVTWGSGLATLVWLAVSVAFTIYLENFADYSATYGSLGALVGLLLWVWIAVMILIVGAEINSEMEHQTARDTTTGPERPMGGRGAVMADTLGERAD